MGVKKCRFFSFKKGFLGRHIILSHNIFIFLWRSKKLSSRNSKHGRVIRSDATSLAAPARRRKTEKHSSNKNSVAETLTVLVLGAAAAAPADTTPQLKRNIFTIRESRNFFSLRKKSRLPSDVTSK